MSTWMNTWLMTAAIKGGAILILALVAARLLRRQPAAVRHSVWLAAILSQLLIPAFGVAFPQWRLTMPEAVTTTVTRAAIAVAPAQVVTREISAPAPTPVLDPSLQVGGAGTRAASVGTVGSSVTPASAATSAIAWPTLLLYVWMVGAGAVVLWLIIGTIGVAVVARRASRVTDGAWLSLVSEVSAELGLRRGVVLLRGRGLSVPVTWGILAPVVLVPDESDAWPIDRRRTVLLHELAHVTRLDALSQLVAHIVLALCWFDPLVWVGVRALRSESEKACDDAVLRHGTEPSAYVTDLLSIVRAARPSRVPAMAALAMARPTEFEGRVLAILDATARRRAVGRAAQLATAVAALALVAPLAAMQPATARTAMSATADPTSPSETTDMATADVPNVIATAPMVTMLGTDEHPAPRKVGRNDVRLPVAPPAPPAPAASAQPPVRLSPMPVPTPTPTPTPSPSVIGGGGMHIRTPRVNVRVSTRTRSSRSSNSEAVTPLINAMSDTDIGVRQTATQALGELGDPRAVDALIAALSRDTDAKVRETAAWALGQIDDHKAVPALVQAVQRDQIAAVRKQSAWALGQIQDAESVTGLGAALRDAEPEVRRMAVWALGQIQDARAVPMLVPALTNSDAEVRKQAAWALGQIESKDAVPALSGALKDAEPRVRETAAWALGQIEDTRSVGALGSALKDAAPSVRKNAAWALGQIESKESVPSLVAALEDTDREVRKTAVWALGQIEDPAAVPGLATLTKSQDAETRRSAVQALSRIGGASAVDALVALLKDPDPEVRRAAVSALGRR